MRVRAEDEGETDTRMRSRVRSRHHRPGSQMKLITPSALVERLKINGALARAAIKELQEKGMIKPIQVHHTQWIYTRDVKGE